MDQTADTIFLWRVAEFEEMGFSNQNAQLLALSKDDQGYSLDIYKVRKAMEGGCTPELALRIFINA